MKAGDKLICKKDYPSHDTNSKYGNKLFNAGRVYIIEKVWYIDDYEKYYGSRIWKDIACRNYVPSYWVSVYNNELSVRHFSLIKMADCNYFYEHFKSIGEIRKEKLERLYEL